MWLLILGFLSFPAALFLALLCYPKSANEPEDTPSGPSHDDYHFDCSTEDYPFD